MDGLNRLRAYCLLLGMGLFMRRKIQEQYKLNKDKLTQLKRDWAVGMAAIDSASKRQVSITTVRNLRRKWGSHDE